MTNKKPLTTEEQKRKSLEDMKKAADKVNKSSKAIMDILKNNKEKK